MKLNKLMNRPEIVINLYQEFRFENLVGFLLLNPLY